MRTLLFLALPLVAACTNSKTVPPAIGYINSPKLMQQYHGTLAKRKLIEQQAQAWQHSLDSLTASLAALPTARQQARVGQYRGMLQQKLQAASQQADKELLAVVNDYLKKYGKAKGYDFIFGANDTGNIVYAADSKDLTSDVLIGLNREYDQQQPTAR